MEQSSIPVIQDDLSVRSKKALTRGILSWVIPYGIIFLNIFLFVILTVALGIGAHMFDSDRTAIILMMIEFIGYFFLFLVAGVVMMILGKGTWNRVRAIRQDAIQAGVRRPATSFVAQVFGISSFFTGLFLVVFFTFFLLIMVVIAVIAGVASAL